MNRLPRLLSIAIAGGLVAGCVSPKGITPDEQRNHTHEVYQETLDQFYAAQPSLRDLVKQAAGHVVFTSVDGQYLLFGGGNGFGMAVDEKTGSRTYLKRLELGLGFGLGIRSYRTLIVFRDQGTLDRLLEAGWDLGGDATAALQAGEKGGSAAMAGNPRSGVQVWEFTESGVIAKLAVNGSKAWRNADLN